MSEEMLIKTEDSFGMPYYEYGQAFFGSFRGMRYKIVREPMDVIFFLPPEEKAKGKFVVTVWPEPNSFDNTDESLKTNKEFPFTAEGKEEITKWLNEQYNQRIDEWTGEGKV